MKKILLTLFLITICTLNADFNLRLRVSGEYDSNIYSLSEYDFDRFKDAAAFGYIDTSDDFKQRIDLRLSTQQSIKNINITPFAGYSFTNFMNNNDKNSWSILVGANTNWKKLTLNGAYGYYPENYIRRYIDSDGTEAREKFEYNKMLWRLNSSYRYNNYVIPLLYGKYEYYHHNEYFTEYDGPAITAGLGWRFLGKFLNADIMYYYRTYNPSSDNADIQYMIDNIKDGSYDSNIYEIKLRTKRLYNSLFDYRVYVNYKYEDRYFQSEIPLVIDSYHTTRNDMISTINIGSDLWLNKSFALNLDFLYRFREVSSDHYPVIRDKEYDKYQIKTTLEYNFKI